MSEQVATKERGSGLCYEHEYPKGGMHVQVWRKEDCPFCKLETARRLLEPSRYCVRNELNRTEQQILAIEKSKPTPGHLNPTGYLETLNKQADDLQKTLDGIEAYLGLEST